MVDITSSCLRKVHITRDRRSSVMYLYASNEKKDQLTNVVFLLFHTYRAVFKIKIVTFFATKAFTFNDERTIYLAEYCESIFAHAHRATVRYGFRKRSV